MKYSPPQGSIEDKSGNGFGLTSKETLEILSVLHQTNPNIPARQRNPLQQSRTYHCSIKSSQPRLIAKSPPATNNEEESTLSPHNKSLVNVEKTASEFLRTEESNTWVGDYRCATELISDSDEDDSNSPDDNYGGNNQLFRRPFSGHAESKSVKSKTQLHGDTSEYSPPLSKCNKRELTRNNLNESFELEEHELLQDNTTPSNKMTEHINHQVATIGERVRRTLSFDSEDYDSPSNGINEQNGHSNKRAHPQSNLLKTLMKRSYQLSSESSWSSCKQAKAETPEVSQPLLPVESNGTIDLSTAATIATTVATLSRPDSPATLLGDQEVSQLTSEDNGITATAAINISCEAQTPPMRSSLDSPSHSVFHLKTGLPLTSSPAPLRRTNGCRFDYDSSLSSVAAIKR